MIIDSIALTNFRVFRGFNSIKLTPEDKEHPVILIGALNGGGKTTLLDALKLVLYGKLANCSKKSKQSYPDFIAECINDQTPKDVGCTITMCFRTYLDGVEESYKISRSWKFEGKSLSEKFKVEVNHRENSVLEKSWDEFVDSFIPVRLSHLFFFDGEKIEEFATPESAKELLAQGIHSLLGIDTVSQLEKDLEVVVRKKQSLSQRSDQQREALNQHWKTVSALNEQKTKSRDELNVAEAALVELKEKLERADAEFRKFGGEAYQEKSQYEHIIAAAKNELAQQEKKAEDFAAGLLPFALLRSDVQELIRQAESEEDAKRYAQFESSVLQIEKLVRAEIEGVLTAEQKDLFSAAFKKAIDTVYNKEDADAPLLNIASSTTFDLLKGLPESLARENELLGDFLQTASETLLQLETYQRKLENIPADDIIAPLLAKTQKLQDRISQQEMTVATLKEIYRRDENAFSAEKTSFIKELEAEIDDDLAKQDDIRLIQRSKDIAILLEKFRNAMLEKYIGRIESYITESFRRLLHKESLVDVIRIDKSNYEISLISKGGLTVNPDKLSAGERQLLGVSMLWGLAKAAARPLPSVVDTPLGRLDSSHRENLIERYFPDASHQVILLSTDEEIYGDYYEKLKPFISRSYTVVYDDKTRSSKANPGYQFSAKSEVK